MLKSLKTGSKFPSQLGIPLYIISHIEWVHTCLKTAVEGHSSVWKLIINNKWPKLRTEYNLHLALHFSTIFALLQIPFTDCLQGITAHLYSSSFTWTSHCFIPASYSLILLGLYCACCVKSQIPLDSQIIFSNSVQYAFLQFSGEITIIEIAAVCHISHYHYGIFYQC